MEWLTKSLAALLLVVMAPPCAAAEPLRVFAMTYPAWVVRDYQTQPLSPGFQLEAQDLLRTGSGGRLLLQLADGSALKLGESARLVIGAVEDKADSAAGGSGGGHFNLLRGALRHSTAVWGESPAESDVKIEVGGLLAATVGADIWGRSTGGEDLIALLAGKINLLSASDTPLLLDQPGTYVVKSGAEPLSPLRPLDEEKLRDWLALTELTETSGIAAHDGEWHLVVASLTNLRKTEQRLKVFRERGFPVWRKSVIRDGRTLHRILLPGFVSIDAALAARAGVKSLLGVADAWVWKTPR